jgi:hypothetical protein
VDKIVVAILMFTFWKVLSKAYCANHHQSFHKGLRIKDGDTEVWICSKCSNRNKIVKKI